MRLTLSFIISFLSLTTLGQVGKLDIKMTLTKADTTYPYFLDTWVKKGDSIVIRIAITSSGLHHFGNFKQGVYNLELHDHRSRAMKIDSVQIIADSITTLSISYPGFCKYIYPAGYKPMCPKGHNDSIVNIMYGFASEKMVKKAKKGLIHLGGCIITDCDPKYYCTKHKIEL